MTTSPGQLVRPVPTGLTSTSNGCDLERGGGQQHVRSKAQSIETVCGAEGQGKACMAKVTLLEPQFAATNPRGGIAERLTRYLGQSGGAAFTPPARPKDLC